jgi:DNA repair exonuclease SbcCD ATPase subunit
MIVQLCEEVKALAQQKRELEKFRNQLQDLSLTISEIQTVTLEANKVKSNYILVYSRLPTEHKINVESRILELISQVRNSRQDFSTARRQTVALRNITGNIRGLNGSIEASWKLAVEGLLMPYFELYNLVRQLPDFKSEEAELILQKSRLDYFKNNLPKNIYEMREFDQTFEKFRQGLASIQGLTSSIQAFLTKVVNHTASIADLNDEIIAWCQQAGRNKVFQIQFRN